MPLAADYFTRGEQSLLKQDPRPQCKKPFSEKNQGMQAFAVQQFQPAAQHFQDAINLFKRAPRECYVDPETLIFLNNAKANQGNPITIAAVIPTNGQDLYNDRSQEMLRGVAHVQDNFNQNKGIKGRLLQVIIARDDNDVEIGKRVAKHLGDNKIPGDSFKGEVLGVVGPFTSDVALYSGKVYETQQLVAVSPVSTADRQPKRSQSGYEFDLSKYVFRTAPSNSVAAEKLFQYSQTIHGSEQPAIIYDSQQSYSLSLKDAFERKFPGQQVISCDIYGTHVVDCISQASNAKFLMLALGSASAKQASEAIDLNLKKLPLLGGDALYSDDKLSSEVKGDNAENMVLAVSSHIDIFTMLFKEESNKFWRTKSVGWRTAATYDAAEAVVEALRQNPTRNGLYNTLSSPNFSVSSSSLNFPVDGTTAPVQFDNLHDRKINHKIGVLVQVKKQCTPNDNDNQKYKFCLLQNY